jgi:sugar diacid utilization regulator
MIFIRNVYEHLARYNPEIWEPPRKEEPLKDIYFLSSNNLGDSSYLYMGTVSAVLPIINQIVQSHLLLIEDILLDASARSQLLQQGCSVVLLSKESEIFDTYNLVKELFSEQQRFYQQSYVLYNELLNSKNLDQVVALSEKELNNPIILIDESFKVIKYSKGITVTDDIWADNIKNGYCSYEFVSEVNKLNSVRKSPATMEPFSVKCHANQITKLVSKLYFEKKLIGYLVIPECHSNLEREKVKLVTVISKIMVHHLNQSVHHCSSRLVYQEKLLIDLIENDIHSESELSARLKLSGVSMTSPYYLVMIKSNLIEATKIKTEALQSQIFKLYPEAMQLIYKGALLVLLSQKEWKMNSESKQQPLAEILEQKNLQGIYSDSNTDLLNLSSCYNQLLKGFELATFLGNQEALLPYNDLKFYQLLHDTLYNEKMLNYCHPAILKLLNVDQVNNTSYYETLQAFLLNGQNSNEAASQLFIHRNTIKYRMRKIVELTNIDLDRGETVFQLAYSFKILNYTNKRDSLIDNWV